MDDRDASAVTETIITAMIVLSTLVAIVPAALAVVGVVRRGRPRRTRRSARDVRHEERASLEAVRAQVSMVTPDGHGVADVRLWMARRPRQNVPMRKSSPYSRAYSGSAV